MDTQRTVLSACMAYTKREQEVFTKIKEAAKAVMVEQKLDAVMDIRGVFVGGVDITDSVIAKLKGGVKK